MNCRQSFKVSSIQLPVLKKWRNKKITYSTSKILFPLFYPQDLWPRRVNSFAPFFFPLPWTSSSTATFSSPSMSSLSSVSSGWATHSACGSARGWVGSISLTCVWSYSNQWIHQHTSVLSLLNLLFISALTLLCAVKPSFCKVYNFLSENNI